MRAPPALAFVICTLIWGSTWFAIKIGYEGLDPVFGAFLRFAVAGLLLVPLALATKAPWPRSRQHIKLVLWVAFLMFFLDYGLIYWAEKSVSSGLTSLLFATFPFFAVLGSVALLPGDRLTTRQLLGMVLGFGGLVYVFRDDLSRPDDLVPALAVVAAAATGAMSGVLVRKWGRDLAPMTLNATSMLLGAAMLLPASLLLGERPSLPSTTNSWIALAYLVAFGSIIGFLLYWQLLKTWPVNRAGLVPLATPIVALVIQHFWETPMTTEEWVGSILTLGGVALAILSKRSTPPAPVPDAAAVAK